MQVKIVNIADQAMRAGSRHFWRAQYRAVRQSAFIKNVLIVMSGSAVAQGIGFALSPVISRFYTPTDFGVFGAFSAITGVMASVGTLDYSQAIMLPKRHDDAGQVFLLSCGVSLVVTLSCLGACLLLPNWTCGLLKSHNRWLLVLLVLAVLAGALNASFQAWCVRIKAFTQTSASQAVRGLTSNSLQVGFGLLKAGAPGLIASSVVADFTANLNLVRFVRKDLRTLLAAAQWSGLKRLALEYRDFPAYSATQNLLNALSNGLPVLLLSHYYGIAAAGAYAFAMRLLNAPMSLVLGALRQVLFQKAGEAQHQDQPLAPLFLKATLALLAIGVLPAILLSVWSPALFAWLFGSQWRVAGEFARYLTLWLLFAFCNLPAVLFARLIRIQRNVFFFNVILLAARVLTLVAGGLYLSACRTVLVFSIVGAVLNLLLIIMVGRTLLHNPTRTQTAESGEALIP